MDATERSSDNVLSAAPSDIECQTPVDLEQSSSDAQEILQAEALDPPVYELLLLQHSSVLINRVHEPCAHEGCHLAACQLRVMLNRLSHPGQTLPVHSCSTPGKHNLHKNQFTQKDVQKVSHRY